MAEKTKAELEAELKEAQEQLSAFQALAAEVQSLKSEMAKRPTYVREDTDSQHPYVAKALQKVGEQGSQRKFTGNWKFRENDTVVLKPETEKAQRIYKSLKEKEVRQNINFDPDTFVEEPIIGTVEKYKSQVDQGRGNKYSVNFPGIGKDGVREEDLALVAPAGTRFVDGKPV